MPTETLPDVTLANETIQQAQSLHEQAEETLQAIRSHVSEQATALGPNIETGVDTAVAGLVDDANTEEIHERASQLVGVATGVAEEYVTGGNAPFTAKALDASPVELLAPALYSLEASKGPAAVETVVESIEAAGEKTVESNEELYEQTPIIEIEGLPLVDYSIPDEEAAKLFRENDPKLLTTLRKISELPPLKNGQEVIARQWAVRVLENSYGLAVGWRKQIQDGAQDAELLEPFINAPDMGLMCFRNANIRYMKNLNALKDADQYDKLASRNLVQQYREQVKAAIDVAIPNNDDPDSPNYAAFQLVNAFWKHGDLGSYAVNYDKKTGIMAPSEELLHTLNQYLENVAMITPETAVLLHQELGIVNFHRYSEHQLRFASDVVRGDPETLEMIKQSGGLSLLIAGKNGDHNGAFVGFMTHETMEDSSIMPTEIEQRSDIDKLVTFLQERGIDQLRHLTIAGHGGKAGIHIAKNVLIHDSKASFAGLPRFTKEVIRHDYKGLQAIYSMLQSTKASDAPKITLVSCSQAKRFFGRQRTMADAIATENPGVEVLGADDIMHIKQEIGEDATSGDIYMVGLTGLSKVLKIVEKKTDTPERIDLHDKLKKLGLFDYKYEPNATSVVARPDGRGGYTLISTKPVNGKVKAA